MPTLDAPPLSAAPPPAKPGGPLKWILMGCGCAVLLAVLGMAGFFLFVLQMIKGSESYTLSEDYIRSSAAVKESLGDVQAFGFMPGGLQSITNDSGTAGWDISVTGAKGSGTVVVFWTKKSGSNWKLDEAYLQKDGKEKRIDAPGDWGPVKHRAQKPKSSHSLDDD